MIKFNPLISTIIPVYNGENYIKYAINSVLNQTYKNIEIIVVDNGTKDNTVNIIKAFINRVICIYKNNYKNTHLDTLNCKKYIREAFDYTMQKNISNDFSIDYYNEYFYFICIKFANLEMIKKNIYIYIYIYIYIRFGKQINIYNKIFILNNKIEEYKSNQYSNSRIKCFGIYNDQNNIYLYFLFIKFRLKINDNVMNRIALWIIVKKCCKNSRTKFQIILETIIYIAIIYTCIIYNTKKCNLCCNTKLQNRFLFA